MSESIELFSPTLEESLDGELANSYVKCFTTHSI